MGQVATNGCRLTSRKVNKGKCPTMHRVRPRRRWCRLESCFVVMHSPCALDWRASRPRVFRGGERCRWKEIFVLHEQHWEVQTVALFPGSALRTVRQEWSAPTESQQCLREIAPMALWVIDCWGNDCYLLGGRRGNNDTRAPSQANAFGIRCRRLAARKSSPSPTAPGPTVTIFARLH